jgi:hypothetical protein
MARDRAGPRTLKKSIESVQRLMNAVGEEIPGFSR